MFDQPPPRRRPEPLPNRTPLDHVPVADAYPRATSERRSTLQTIALATGILALAVLTAASAAAIGIAFEWI